MSFWTKRAILGKISDTKKRKQKEKRKSETNYANVKMKFKLCNENHLRWGRLKFPTRNDQGGKILRGKTKNKIN